MATASEFTTVGAADQQRLVDYLTLTFPDYADLMPGSTSLATWVAAFAGRVLDEMMLAIGGRYTIEETSGSNHYWRQIMTVMEAGCAAHLVANSHRTLANHAPETIEWYHGRYQAMLAGIADGSLVLGKVTANPADAAETTVPAVAPQSASEPRIFSDDDDFIAADTDNRIDVGGLF